MWRWNNRALDEVEAADAIALKLLYSKSFEQLVGTQPRFNNFQHGKTVVTVLFCPGIVPLLYCSVSAIVSRICDKKLNSWMSDEGCIILSCRVSSRFTTFQLISIPSVTAITLVYVVFFRFRLILTLNLIYCLPC